MNDEYFDKYLKYKKKYLNLKQDVSIQNGGKNDKLLFILFLGASSVK